MSEYTISLPTEVMRTQRSSSVQYAGFGKRLAAYVIDWLVIGAVQSAIFAVMLLIIVGSVMNPFTDPAATSVGVIMLFLPLLLPSAWLYFSLQESSTSGATIGKRAMGLRVTDTNGQRITFLHATGRYFGKIISSCVFGVGYLMIAFTDRHQGLHDMMAATYVLDLAGATHVVPPTVAQQAAKW